MGKNPTNGRKALTAEDIMTQPVVTVREDQDIWSLSWSFVRLHITGMPVVDRRGKLVGMISQTDLAAFIWKQASAGEEFFVGVKRYEDGVRGPVLARELMTRKVVKAGLHTPVDELARTMRRLKIHRLPIVQGDRLLGIVTTMDMLKAMG